MEPSNLRKGKSRFTDNCRRNKSSQICQIVPQDLLKELLGEASEEHRDDIFRTLLIDAIVKITMHLV